MKGFIFMYLSSILGENKKKTRLCTHTFYVQKVKLPKHLPSLLVEDLVTIFLASSSSLTTGYLRRAISFFSHTTFAKQFCKIF